MALIRAPVAVVLDTFEARCYCAMEKGSVDRC